MLHDYKTMLILLVILNVSHRATANMFMDSAFEDFIENEFDVDAKEKIVRRDLKWGSSFGGAGRDITKPTVLNPVILIHGVQGRAGVHAPMRDALKEWGYNDDEIYSTTYGRGGVDDPIFRIEMKCAYVRQVRTLIRAVYRYTRKKVDVVAYSMGSAVARKAIVGGECVDTKENLGGPITGFVETYLSVAGANHGSALCLPAFTGICGSKIGLYCGSEFLNDINSKSGYEGSQVISMFSPFDEWIGVFTICAKKSYLIEGSKEVRVLSSHADLCKGHFAEQIEELTKKYGADIIAERHSR